MLPEQSKAPEVAVMSKEEKIEGSRNQGNPAQGGNFNSRKKGGSVSELITFGRGIREPSRDQLKRVEERDSLCTLQNGRSLFVDKNYIAI